MNTERKPVEYLTCRTCGETYAQVGDTSILLAEHRKARGEGQCPKHKK